MCAVKIGHASCDEYGRASGGQAGDQTGKEVCVRDWYAGAWNVVLRPKSEAVVKKMAAFCETVCNNPNVGYDQYQRNTLRAAAQMAGWDGSKITTACETDCSAFMTVCAEAAGVKVPYYYGNAPTTFTMRGAFMSTGAFEVLTDGKYLTSDKYLKRGDILVRESGHTAMVLSDGASSGIEEKGERIATPVCALARNDGGCTCRYLRNFFTAPLFAVHPGICSSRFKAAARIAETFTPASRAAASSQAGRETFLRTARLSFLRRYSAKSTDTSVTISLSLSLRTSETGVGSGTG